MSDWKIVCVIWEDSRQPEPSWQIISEIDEESCNCVICLSVGFLVQESDTAIGLALSVGDIGSENAQASGIAYIPKSAIKFMANVTSLEVVFSSILK